MIVRELEETDRDALASFIREQWGSDVQAFRQKLFRPAELPGILAEEGGSVVGAATLLIEGDTCEIVTFNGTPKGRGVGTALVDAIVEHAKRRGCTRIRVTTTNANLDALRFYMRRGFRLHELRIGAVDRSREVKPDIPETGLYGIPMHDEVELEMLL